VKIFATTSLALLLLLSMSCGGGSSKAVTSQLSGNWQLSLTQNYPTPTTQLSVSGFLMQSNSSLTGNVQGPTITDGKGDITCGGVGPLTGTINGQNVSFTVSPGGTTFNFTGTISSDNTSMSGVYQAQAGACFNNPTTGSWTASLIPSLNGSFTGTITNSQYMAALTGTSAPVINVTGTMSQTPNVGSNVASLSGTITAQSYPCFATASLTGTISGDNVLLSVYSYNGDLIGSIGSKELPAIVAAGSSGTTLSTGQGGLQLGSDNSGPCPVIQLNGANLSTDAAEIALTF
jgi:hypothetical protein